MQSADIDEKFDCIFLDPGSDTDRRKGTNTYEYRFLETKLEKGIVSRPKPTMMDVFSPHVSVGVTTYDNDKGDTLLNDMVVKEQQLMVVRSSDTPRLMRTSFIVHIEPKTMLEWTFGYMTHEYCDYDSYYGPIKIVPVADRFWDFLFYESAQNGYYGGTREP
jgi:hypothetical protein